jgi:hypothetical protein
MATRELQPWCAVTALAGPTGQALHSAQGKGGDFKRGKIAHLVDKEFVERANTVLLLGILWTGRAVCIIGALAYDIAYWLQNW